MDNSNMKIQATVEMPSAKDVDKQIRALEKNISKLKISGKLDDKSLKNMNKQLTTLKATVATVNFSPTALNELTNQVTKALSNINISGVNVESDAAKAGQKIGQDFFEKIASKINSFSNGLDWLKEKLELFDGFKNVGSPKMFGLNIVFCFEYTDSMLVLLDTVV